MISVVGRAELLSAIFYLSGLLLIVGDGLRVDHSSKWRLAGCIVLCSLGLLCKEQALMLIPLLVCFILVDNLELCSKELATSRRPSKSFKTPKPRPLLKATKTTSQPFGCSYRRLILDVLLSSLLPSFLACKQQSRHNNLLNPTKLNQLNKKLRKSNKTIWTLVACFAVVLCVRLAAQGGTLSVHFSALDQIQSMVHEAGDRFKDANVTTDDAARPTPAAWPAADEARKTSKKFNSLSAFLTSAYVIAHNFWLLFYPDRLSCDWSFGSLAPVLHLSDAHNLFSFTLLVGLGLVPFLKCFDFNHQSRSGAVVS